MLNLLSTSSDGQRHGQRHARGRRSEGSILRPIVGVLAVSIVAASSDLASADGERAVFRAAAEVVDVTPPVGLPMWGYGVRKDAPSRGVRDPLLAGIAVLELGDDRLALVGLDAGRPPARATMEWIRREAAQRAGVDAVFVVASHTHHGPCLELEDVEPTGSWIRTAREGIVEGIRRASERLEPASVAVASRDVSFNRNRHSKIRPAPVDRRLSVISLRDAAGRAMATIANFAAHPTSISAAVLEYSADYPGPLRRRVEAELGGRCIFLQGAVGDMSCDRGGRDMAGFAEALADEVISLAGAAVPVEPSRSAISVRSEEFSFESRVDLRDPIVYFQYCVAFFKDLVDAYVREYDGGRVRPRLDVALLGGEIGIVGVSGEFFASHAIRLRERARLEHLLFVGPSNGYHQYFPTIEAVAEGGYGADEAVAPAAVGAGECVMDRALILLVEMRKATR